MPFGIFFAYFCANILKKFADLAVNKHYQSTGIGKDLVKKVRNVIGEKVALILLSGMGY
jgi:hypothetical protein